MKLATSKLAGKFETSLGHHPSLNPVLCRKKGPPAPSCFPQGEAWRRCPASLGLPGLASVLPAWECRWDQHAPAAWALVRRRFGLA